MIKRGAEHGEVAFRETLKPGDAEAVRRIVAGTGFFSDEEVGIAVELVVESIEKGQSSGYAFIFAEVEGVVQGYGCYGLIPCSTLSWDLYWIAVSPARQGTGLGRVILEMIESRIAAAGGLTVYAETSGREEYVPTRIFYNRCGYTEGAVFEDFYGPGDAKHIFVKRLRP